MLTINIDKRFLIGVALFILNGFVIYGSYRIGYKNAVNDIVDYLNSRGSTNNRS